MVGGESRCWIHLFELWFTLLDLLFLFIRVGLGGYPNRRLYVGVINGKVTPLNHFENYQEISQKGLNCLLSFGIEKLKGFELQGVHP